MRKSIYAIMLLAAIGLSSCDEAKRLASDIEGVWSGAPERLVDNQSATASIIPTLEFIRTDTDKSGTVTYSALINVTDPMAPSAAVTQPYSMSASATAVITGTWQAVSDDDVVITWDDKSLNVRVDPKAVVLTSNQITGTEAPVIDSIKPRLAESLQTQIAQAVEVKVLPMRKLDDVKVRKGILEFEVNHDDVVMHKQE